MTKKEDLCSFCGYECPSEELYYDHSHEIQICIDCTNEAKGYFNCVDTGRTKEGYNE